MKRFPRFMKYVAKITDYCSVVRSGKYRLPTIYVAISIKKQCQDIAFEGYPPTKSTITNITRFVITYLKKPKDQMS